MSEQGKKPRGVARVLRAMDTSDGAGVSLKRSVGSPQLDMLDPFLMLDSISTDNADEYIAGFPEHPHRGFETVTYMVEGAMRHKDSMGNEGVLRSGGVQWMTAGSGILHSESPEQENGLLQGFQLWINLPAKDKMVTPRYQNIEGRDVAEFSPEDGVDLRLVAGEFMDKTGPVNGIATKPVFIDAKLAADREVTLPVPEGHAAMVYVFIGDAIVADKDITTHHLAVLEDGDSITLKGGPEGGRMLLIAARPLHEPVVRYGPFVMSSKQELMQAFDDYQRGRFVRAAAAS
ncbi:pirin family protein [Thalassospira sp. MCCC 1A03138]|uniref:pirin family protein n=1 Tax=Thalassospira sp. MCCC 1A03138 TaxID=1470576 RepID=UPI000A1E79E8|nr:pirin family protein [Thalassospira sp. MCCC 1A03138]OSQ32351.1 pirin [Thalassospira sp. MCCC 1A03138]